MLFLFFRLFVFFISKENQRTDVIYIESAHAVSILILIFLKHKTFFIERLTFHIKKEILRKELTFLQVTQVITSLIFRG